MTARLAQTTTRTGTPASGEYPGIAASGIVGRGAGRLDWLDVLRVLAILEIIGFHWLRTCQENGAFHLVFASAYENPGIGFDQLNYLITDKSGLSLASLANNAIGLVFGYGWEAVNVFILLSGVGLALSYQPARAGFTLASWYRRRYLRVLLPYYVVALPMLLLGELLKAVGTGRPGLLGTMAQKLAVKNLPDPIGIELAKHVFLVDPREDFWTTAFFSPAWWFIPPILVAYLCFPLFWRGLERLGTGVMLVLALVATAIGYTLSARGLLWVHSMYFVVFNECFNFVVGIAVGRALATNDARVRARQLLARPGILLLGAALFAAGSVANSFTLTHPVSSPVYTAGLTMILGFVAAWLARIPAILTLARRADGYHIYLLHQWLAYPLVLVTVTLFGAAAPTLGFASGFVVYIVFTIVVVLIFERVVWRPIAYALNRKPATPAPRPHGA